MPVFTFLLMSFAYHSDMILIKGANSNVSGFSLSMPLLTAIKAHVVPSEYLHSVADLEIVAPPARQVFHNADTDFPVLHIVHHAGVGRTVKKSAAFVVVQCSAGYWLGAALWHSSPKRFFESDLSRGYYT